jgi:hypothetical protein
MKRLSFSLDHEAFAAAGPALAADAQQQVFDLFSKIASALANDDAGMFVGAIDPAMPHFYEFAPRLSWRWWTWPTLTNSVEVISDTATMPSATKNWTGYLDIDQQIGFARGGANAAKW